MALQTKYTNGFDHTKVVGALSGRLAWREQAGIFPLTDANKTTKSGRHFDSFHALCNITNIYNTASEDASSTAEKFNTYLTSLYGDVIYRALGGVFADTELIEQVLLYERDERNETPIINTGLFCGYKIEIPQNSRITAKIEAVNLYFDAEATFKLYLFKDGIKEPLLEKEVTTIAGSIKRVELEDFYLQYLSDMGDGGTFYFGYFQDDLGAAQAIQEEVECWNTGNCFEAEPYATKKTGTKLFDRRNPLIPGKPYGLNLVISTFKDNTAMIVQKAHLFDELIGLQMAAMVVENILFTSRSNKEERSLKGNIGELMVYMELKGTVPISQAPNTVGLAKRIEKELVKLQKTFNPKPKTKVVNLS